MALKQLLVAQRLKDLRAKKEELAQAIAATEAKRAAWTERESRAEAALAEMTDETTAEERAAFDAECAEIEAEDQAITAEEEANSTRAAELEEKISAAEAEEKELKEKAGNARAQKPAETPAENNTERGGVTIMPYADERARRTAEIREICRNDEVRNFIGIIKEKRAVQGATYTIPTLMQPMIVEAIKRNSKLYRHVNTDEIRGDGKYNVLASAPEAVWTETTGKLNELAMAINQFLTHGSKLGGFVPVPNPYLEDSVEDLAGIVVDLLGQSNGYALDKAILYGTGTNMPVGIVTRLAATQSPAWWQPSMPTFTDLHASHIGKLSAASVKGVDLYREMVGVLGLAEQKHLGKGGLFWAMNQTTFTKLKQELLSINAAGAVVTGAEPVMPVIGGAVELLDFVPANNIVGGWGQEYKLVQRKGIQIALSEHAQFVEDNTLFKGTSRWDGLPYYGEGFAAFSLTTTAVTTSVTFAPDTANQVSGG